MSMVARRAPLESIGMNDAGGVTAPKRRSARLSGEGHEENEPPSKRAKIDGGATAQSVSTKTQDGGSGAAEEKRNKRRKVYDQESDGFVFTKNTRAKAPKQPAIRPAIRDSAVPSERNDARTAIPEPVPAPPPADEPAPATAKKPRRRLPTTPEQGAKPRTTRKNQPPPREDPFSPHKAAHARSHANTELAHSPVRPVTVEKKRRNHVDSSVEEEKTARITLPVSDTPIIRRNREMRKSMADGTHRRSSSSMRGRRASSLIDIGKGNAYPHAEVPTAELFKHISADLMEPRRMRCLLGWCGKRALYLNPEAPKDSSNTADEELRALQAARVIQEELAQDLNTNAALSDWFSRDDEPRDAMFVRKKKPNPRNVANAAKVQELERELERLKHSRQGWDDLIASAVPPTPTGSATANTRSYQDAGGLSPLQPELLSSPQRHMLEQLQQCTADESADPEFIQQRLQNISSSLEFSMDTITHSVHALSTTRQIAERIAERSLSEAANMLETREREREARSGGKKVDALEALRGLAKVMNARR